MSATRRTVLGSLFAPRDLIDRIEKAMDNPVLAYGAIIVLQLRVIWNVWQYKDLTGGDTSRYFIDVASWAHGLHTDIVYSPLYAIVWGTILATVHDVYAAAMVTRMAIILAAAILVLAVMRSLFEPAIALLMAVWWTIVPANFNLLYDIHLFGLLMVLIAVVVVVRVPRRSGLGIALAILLCDTVLVRNEVFITSVIFAVAITVYEIRERRSHRARFSAYAWAYGVPIAIACLLVGGLYSRSYIQGHEAVRNVEAKQKLNLCEAYAFSYQQRHPDRVPGEAFTSCTPIMQHDFQHPMPSFFEAVDANPRAMAGFVAWNIRLLPSGLEVALFNATAGGENPGYPPPQQHRKYVLILTILLVVVMFGGLIAQWRERQFWRREWLPLRAWTLVVLGSAAIGTLIVTMTERPWSEYMYGFTVGVLVLAGLGLSAILRWFGGTRVAPVIVGGLVVLLIIALPSYYTYAPRPLHAAVKRLQVIRRELQRPGSVLIAEQHESEICSYLAQTFDDYCASVSWPTLRLQLLGGAPIQQVLDRAKATAIYADSTMVNDPAFSGLLAAPQAAGWRQVTSGVGPDGPWRVLIRAYGVSWMHATVGVLGTRARG